MHRGELALPCRLGTVVCRMECGDLAGSGHRRNRCRGAEARCNVAYPLGAFPKSVRANGRAWPLTGCDKGAHRREDKACADGLPLSILPGTDSGWILHWSLVAAPDPNARSDECFRLSRLPRSRSVRSRNTERNLLAFSPESLSQRFGMPRGMNRRVLIVARCDEADRMPRETSTPLSDENFGQLKGGQVFPPSLLLSIRPASVTANSRSGSVGSAARCKMS